MQLTNLLNYLNSTLFVTVIIILMLIFNALLWSTNCHIISIIYPTFTLIFLRNQLIEMLGLNFTNKQSCQYSLNHLEKVKSFVEFL